jgi:CRISPR-associated protein Csx10
MRRVPTPRSNLEFAAAGRLLDPALAEHFEAAIRATTHVGSGRSRGLARVDLELAWLDASPSTTPELPNGDLELRLTLRSPTSLGAPVAGDNLRGTRQEIPGSALRGALGFALAEALPQASEQIFVDLFGDGQEHHPGATFGFLYPTAIQRDPEASPSGKAGRVPDPSLFPATPLPLTATACKFDPRRHPRHDILLDRIASHLAASAADARNVHESSLQRCTHPGCEAPLRGQHGVRGLHEGVPTRLISRVSLDRSRASARDGQLFTQELLTPGTTFTGTIRNIPSGSREHLALALAQPLSLGRGRSSGWGRVEVSVQPAPVAPDIVARAEAFDRALGQRLARVRLPTARIGRLIPITLHSPLVPVTDDGRAELLESVAPATLLFSARRFTRDGGWDQRAGLMQPLLTVEAGAVFVLELPEGQHWREFLAQLRHLEASGLGTRRHQGFGHALCFDPFHAQPATTK